MNINSLLLKTAFSCMACDGHIAKEELDLIRRLAEEKSLFCNININDELDRFISEINTKGHLFLRDYLSELNKLDLTEQEELDIATVAIQIIRADDKIEYGEIKFFKLIRASLKKVTDENLLRNLEGIDETYLANDIQDDYFLLHESYFNALDLPTFDINMLNAYEPDDNS